LLENRNEVRNTADLFNGDSYTGDLASEELFKETSGRYYILHLAMHALLNLDKPLQSKLIFTQSNDSSEDNFLNCYEIYNLNLQADLAVLSACNTGHGKLQKGEGVMSLARGFFYAGIPSVVMTLWAVLDQSGAQLMQNFYYYLAEGEDIDIALQKAKIKYLQGSDEITSHPYLWSGYVSLGNPSAIYPGSKNAYVYLIISGVFFLLIVVAFIIYRKKKSRS